MAMASEQVEASVRAALDNSAANGDFEKGGALYQYTAEHIADDLALYDSDLENESPHSLKPHVEAWIKDQEWLYR